MSLEPSSSCEALAVFPRECAGSSIKLANWILLSTAAIVQMPHHYRSQPSQEDDELVVVSKKTIINYVISIFDALALKIEVILIIR